jgi:hypothetical protein
VILFPIALIWIAVVLYFVIVRRSKNEPEQPGEEPRRFRRPPATPRDDRGTPGHSRASRARERSGSQ